MSHATCKNGEVYGLFRSQSSQRAAEGGPQEQFPADLATLAARVARLEALLVARVRRPLMLPAAWWGKNTLVCANTLFHARSKIDHTCIGRRLYYAASGEHGVPAVFPDKMLSPTTGRPPSFPAEAMDEQG